MDGQVAARVGLGRSGRTAVVTAVLPDLRKHLDLFLSLDLARSRLAEEFELITALGPGIFFWVWTQKNIPDSKKAPAGGTGSANPGRLAGQESFFESAPGEEPAGEEFELITTLDPESFFESRLKKAFQMESRKLMICSFLTSRFAKCINVQVL